MNTKAQIVGQIFIFLLAIAIFSLIVIYGYKAITGFTERGETVALLELQNDMERQISVMALDYGSTDKMELRLPTEYKQICFVEHQRLENLQTDYPDVNPFVLDALESGSLQNVFLVPLSDTPMQVTNITVDQAYKGILCLNATQGRIELLLEGFGHNTKISPWS